MSLALELQFRSASSFFLSYAISILLLVFMVLLQHIQFCSPWLWISNTFLDVFVTSKIFLLLCNAVVIGLITLIFREKLSVTDRIVCKTYLICGVFFSWDDLKVLFSSSLLGSVNSLIVVKLLAPDIFSPSLNQRVLMLTACGAFMGLTYCLTVLVLNKLTLNYAYPVGNIFVIMKKQFFARLLTTIGKTLYFLPLYAICLSLFLYPHQRESFIWRVFDYQLILLILVTTFHLQFSWSCVVDVLKSQFLKPIDIPLSSVLDPSRSVLGILSDSSNHLEQHLALERLADLVATNQNVRLSIFSLSHLGGRPVLWKQISNLCFQLIDRFLLNVHKSNNRGVNLLSIPFGARKIDFKFRQFLPSSFDEHLRRRNNVRVKPLPGINGSTYNMQPSESIAHNLTDSSRAFLSKIFTLLSQTQLFSILSSEIAYAPTAHLFATALDIECADCLDTDKPSVQTSGQAIIWATEILACLTLASYNEDHFGSVQRSLGRILLLFADAVEAVEKHLKLVGLLTSQYKQVINCSIADSLCTTTLSTGHLQTPLRNSKQLSGSVFPSDDLCKFTYYCFASDPTLPWRVYATFSWALTNCLNQYSDCFATITLDNKSKEKLQLLKASRCIMREN